MSTWSLPAAERGLQLIPLDHLHAHPANANVMPAEQREKLAANIAATGGYQPLVVRPHPNLPNDFQILDGEQRSQVLPQLGHTKAVCFVWPCDDQTALLLLATLNRLSGEDLPAKRAQLLADLSTAIPPDELALLLPESASTIRETIALLDHDTDALLATLAAAAERHDRHSPRLVSFALDPADEELVEAAVQAASAGLTGANRRAGALTAICRRYLEVRDACEGARHRRVFDRYVSLGDSRSIVRLHAELRAQPGAPSLRSLEEWSRIFHWQQRLDDIERATRIAEDEARIKAIRKMQDRHAREALLLQQKGPRPWLLSSRAISSLRPPSARWWRARGSNAWHGARSRSAQSYAKHGIQVWRT